MLLLRQLIPLARIQTRQYAKNPANMAANFNIAKQVHQEMMRHVNPYVAINIKSDIYVKVRPSDVLDYPDGDAFVAELHGGHVKNCTATMKVHVSDDEKKIDVVLEKNSDTTDFHCELEVPMKAELHINTSHGVNVANMCGGELNVKAQQSINVEAIRAGTISLCSEKGDITCTGLLLGQNTNIETKQSGKITLDKLQGSKLSCKTSKGNITTNCCYVESSQFETDTGCLQLKNVHKKTEVYVHKQGDLNMTGVHGNILVHSNGGSMNLQLSEVTGENVITINNTEESSINISDKIEEDSCIEVVSTEITLDSSLSHLSDCMSKNKQNFKISNGRNKQTKLIVHSKGAIHLGKQSWADSMRAAIGIAEM